MIGAHPWSTGLSLLSEEAQGVAKAEVLSPMAPTVRAEEEEDREDRPLLEVSSLVEYPS
jgi:hypothetical protein